jgi:CHAD domain-containing protein
MAEGLSSVGALPRDAAGAPLRDARRALVEQLDKAVAELEDPRRRSIHEIRKKLKRARAALRLLRDCLGEAVYRRENSLLRDAVRPLTPVRDAKVLFETLRHHDPKKGRADSGSFMRRLYRVLGERRRAARIELRESDLKRVAAGLGALKRRVAALPDGRLARTRASAALKRAYKSARKAFARVRRQRTDERLHEWRKQTQYFANETGILFGFLPKRFGKAHKRARKLAEQLGDDHDLALLTEEVFRHAKGTRAPSHDDTVQEFLGHLAGRRKALQRKAFRLGRRLYSSRARRYQL